MKYKVKTTPGFDKEFKKLDKYTMKMIKVWIEKNLVNAKNPRLHGKVLTANRNEQMTKSRFTCSFDFLNNLQMYKALVLFMSTYSID